MPDRIAIIGGGFSGAMLAARLAERGVASTLIDSGPDFGLGVAYSTPFSGHLLNVRSGRMSAVEGRPDDFVDWLKLQAGEPVSPADPDGFAPRQVYGRYVQDRLEGVEAAHPGRIERVVGWVQRVRDDGVTLADGRTFRARAVVLATGNPEPRTVSGDGQGAGEGKSAIIADPWAKGVLERIGQTDDIVIVGTGLTMVDMLLTLEAGGWRGRATALSRRGLVPRSHADVPDRAATPVAAMLEGDLSDRTHAARALASREGWRGMMEGLRPITARLWAAADLATRSRIVRHLRPWWDVHRHRIAPSIAAVLERLEGEGRLTVVAGRVRGMGGANDGVTVDWTPRPGSGVMGSAPLCARWLIDCTGPGHAPDRDPLTAPLLASGRARLDPLGLGLDLDDQGRVLSRDGVADPALFVLGPPARAAFWETIAVPDIRKRIEDVVGVLAGGVRERNGGV